MKRKKRKLNINEQLGLSIVRVNVNHFSGFFFGMMSQPGQKILLSATIRVYIYLYVIARPIYL